MHLFSKLLFYKFNFFNELLFKNIFYIHAKLKNIYKNSNQNHLLLFLVTILYLNLPIILYTSSWVSPT